MYPRRPHSFEVSMFTGHLYCMSVVIPARSRGGNNTIMTVLALCVVYDFITVKCKYLTERSLNGNYFRYVAHVTSVAISFF